MSLTDEPATWTGQAWRWRGIDYASLEALHRAQRRPAFEIPQALDVLCDRGEEIDVGELVGRIELGMLQLAGQFPTDDLALGLVGWALDEAARILAGAQHLIDASWPPPVLDESEPF